MQSSLPMTDASLIDLTIDHASREPIFQQIYEAVRERIIKGKLDAGNKLPSSRAFARELGVSRSSVVNAYDQLVAEGYATSRKGAGLYVTDLPELRVSSSPGRKDEIFSEPELDYNPVPFYPGVPEMRQFPYEKWARCVSRVARERPHDLLECRHKFGDFRLRKAISDHLSEWRGIEAAPEQIIITAGALGGLELIVKTLTRHNDIIALENPGYKAFRQFLTSGDLKPLWLDVDEDGACIPKGKTDISLAILTASFQYPLGGAMPTARRAEFLNLAREQNFWIIEDDFDSEFRYSGRPIQSLAGMDADGRVLYVGSFSKIFSVGLRIGYVVLPKSMIGQFENTLANFSNIASVVPQAALAEFMDTGEFHKYIRRMRRTYAQRRKLFMSCLKELDDLVDYNNFEAGMQVAVKFRKKLDDRGISRQLEKEGIICPALSDYYVHNPVSGLLMGFCSFTEEEMKKAMTRFSEIIRKNA